MDLSEVNTCYPAKVVSYNPKTQTAQCVLQVEDYYTGLDYSFRKQGAPVLVDVPVLTMQAGQFMMTFPVKAGDDCLLLFAQKGYDHWLYSGASETGLVDGRPTPDHYRAFDLSDGICIVGLRPIPRAIPDYNPNDAELRNEANNQKIVLKANGDIEIHSPTKTFVKAPDVVVEADKTLVKSPDVIIDCPLTKFTGNIQVAGGISMGGGAKTAVCDIKGILQVTGTGTFQGDVVAQGTSVHGHQHTGNAGQPTSPPI